MNDDRNSILKIQTIQNSPEILYQIESDFQISLEFCSGMSESDYFSILTVSPDDTNFHTMSMKDQIMTSNRFGPHRHDFYELMLVLEGSFIHQIEDKEYYYSAGNCCLVNRNVRHREKLTGKARIMFIGFSPEFAADLLDTYPKICFKSELPALHNTLLDFVQKDLDNSQAKEYLDFFPAFQNRQTTDRLHDMAEKLLYNMLFPAFGAAWSCRGMICSIMEYLSDKTKYHTTHIKLNSHADYLLFLRVQHLLEDTGGRISRSELEKHFNYSGDYINRVVKKYSGLCLFDYSSTFTMKKAEVLLSGTDKSISEIMEELNFSNSTHFYQLFKKQFGCTPGKYRKSKST